LIDSFQGRNRDDSSCWSKSKILRRLGNRFFREEGRREAHGEKTAPVQESSAEKISEKRQEIGWFCEQWWASLNS